VLVEFIIFESYWLTKEWISNCCLLNLDEKFISLYKILSTHLFIDFSFLDSSRFFWESRSSFVTKDFFLWLNHLRISLSLRFNFINIVSLIFELIDISAISKINKYERNHLDWMIVKSLDAKSTYWWRNDDKNRLK
jgi:hypothetical protein